MASQPDSAIATQDIETLGRLLKRNVEKAQEFQKERHSAVLDSGSHAQQRQWFHLSGIVSRVNKDPLRDTLCLFKRAEALCVSPQDNETLGRIYRDKAMAYIALINQYNRLERNIELATTALPLLNSSLELLREAGNPEEVAVTYGFKGRLYRKCGHGPDARQEFRYADDILRSQKPVNWDYVLNNFVMLVLAEPWWRWPRYVRECGKLVRKTGQTRRYKQVINKLLGKKGN